MSENENDFFALLTEMLELRFRLCDIYPHVFLFYDKMREEGGEQAQDFLSEFKKYTFDELFKRCDRYAFKESSEFDKILRYTEWVVDGFIKSCEHMSEEKKSAELKNFIASYRKILSV